MLTDNWTDDITGEAYATFLNDLHFCIWKQYRVSQAPDVRRQSDVLNPEGRRSEEMTIAPRYLNDHGFELRSESEITPLPDRPSKYFIAHPLE